MPSADSQPSSTSVAPPFARPAARRPTWPVTAAAVLLGWCLIAWVGFAAAISTAPFFGEQPSRDENIEAGLALATAVVPLALLVVLAVRWGSRWGILLLVAPTLLLVPLGLDWAGSTGSDVDTSPDRPITWADLGSELVRPSWVLAVLLLLVLGASLVRSRRARRTVPGAGDDDT